MDSSTWWSKDTVAVVTGSNKGIGFEIVRQLARNGLTVVLTARDEQRGLAAVDMLKEQNLDVHFHPLDVFSASSVSELASWLKHEFNGVDILVNNAGVVYETPARVIDTNYEGVKKVTKGLLPIMKTSHAGSRIINISSSLGQLEALRNASLREEVSDIEHLTEERLDAFVQRFLKDAEAGLLQENGWPAQFPAYVVSKIALNAYTRLLAKSVENLPVGQKVHANCVCPGYVKTDLNNNRGHLTTEQGADTPVWLALLPPAGLPMGQFFNQRTSIQF